MRLDITLTDPAAVAAELQAIHGRLFPRDVAAWIPQALAWTLECFRGHHEDYLPIDTHYHDLGHTLEASVCLGRLLAMRESAGAEPRLTPECFRNGLLATLLHDSGYLKRATDVEGTGAKYTHVHVERSAVFAERLLTQKGYSPETRQQVQNMIRFTGRFTEVTRIPLSGELERVVGCAVGTADFLSQMASVNYVEKLPWLFEEFEESRRYQISHDSGPDRPMEFASALDLMEKTPGFWDAFVLPKLEEDFLGLYRFLNDPYPDGPNVYVQSVARNLIRIRERVAELKASVSSD